MVAHQHAEMFETWACRPAHALSAQALRIILRNMPARVLRLKGIVRTDKLGWSELQFSGHHGSLHKAIAAPASGAAVVAIGLQHRLPWSVLDMLFASSV